MTRVGRIPSVLTLCCLVLAGVACGGPSPEATPDPTATATVSPDPSDDADIVERAEQVMDLIGAGEFLQAREHFNENLREVLPNERLIEAWESYQDEYGDFVRRGDGEIADVAGARLVDIELEMEGRSGLARVAFDSDDQVGGVFFQDPTDAGAQVPGNA